MKLPKRKETLQTERDVALNNLWPYVDVFGLPQFEGSRLQQQTSSSTLLLLNSLHWVLRYPLEGLGDQNTVH